MNIRAKLLVLTALVSVVLSAPLAAAELNVEYLEGYLEYRDDRGAWMQVNIGDAIPEDGTIRLSRRGFVELSVGGRTVTLTQDGMYETADIVGDDPVDMNFRQVLESKFGALIRRPKSNSGMTVAAVRGAEVEDKGYIAWEDETIDYITEGKILFDSGDISGAKKLFEKGSVWESGAVQRECTFRLALTQQLLGDPRGARQTMMSIQPKSDDPYFDEYTVTMATLYIESMEYQEADAILASYLNKYPNGEAAQAAWLLSGYSQDGMGNTTKSQVSFQRAVEIDPDSAIGQAATELIR